MRATPRTGAGPDTGPEPGRCRAGVRPHTGPRNELSAFGLHIAHDTYDMELTGDGGESVCGGYGHTLAWLPLATANRNPATAEFVYGTDDEDAAFEDCTIRPVLALSPPSALGSPSS